MNYAVNYVPDAAPVLTGAQRWDVLRYMLDSHPELVARYGGDLGRIADDPDRTNCDPGGSDPIERYASLSCNGDRVDRHGWIETHPDTEDACRSLEDGIFSDYPAAPLEILDLDNVALVEFRVSVTVTHVGPGIPGPEVTP